MRMPIANVSGMLAHLLHETLARQANSPTLARIGCIASLKPFRNVPGKLLNAHKATVMLLISGAEASCWETWQGHLFGAKPNLQGACRC